MVHNNPGDFLPAPLQVRAADVPVVQPRQVPVLGWHAAEMPRLPSREAVPRKGLCN